MDCNNCKHLNITEFKQIDKKQDHICLIYNKRVFHNVNTKEHDAKLNPYWKCWDDNYKYYKDR